MGKVYTKGTRPVDYIAEYARRYDTVEIDATFYGTPRLTTVTGWKSRTPETFIFSAKAPQIITHQKLLQDCGADLTEFLHTMDTLGPRLGPIVFQFPYFSRKYNIDEAEFLARLASFIRSLPKDGHQWVVEVRNKAWVNSRLLEVLHGGGVALALIDHPYMHRSEELLAIDGILTSPIVYIRLLGDRYGIEKITKTWGEHVIDREQDLARWAPAVKSILEKNHRVYTYVNSHYSGYAPGDVDRFYALLGIQRDRGELLLF